MNMKYFIKNISHSTNNNLCLKHNLWALRHIREDTLQGMEHHQPHISDSLDLLSLTTNFQICLKETISNPLTVHLETKLKININNQLVSHKLNSSKLLFNNKKL